MRITLAYLDLSHLLCVYTLEAQEVTTKVAYRLPQCSWLACVRLSAS